jgi:hypothetical protein
MGVLARLRVLIATVVTVAAVGVAFSRVGTRLLDGLKQGGQFNGPFSSEAVLQIETVFPLLLSAVLLAVVIWFLASPVQEERSRTRRRP